MAYLWILKARVCKAWQGKSDTAPGTDSAVGGTRDKRDVVKHVSAPGVGIPVQGKLEWNTLGGCNRLGCKAHRKQISCS
jgi:hypothetical protein